MFVTLCLLFVFIATGKTYATTETKLLASDGAADDYFGVSVSISGDVALVGAYWDDDNGDESGSAYVFRWNGSTWVEEQKLLASDGAAGDWFGQSVSISGDVAMVGAMWDDDNGVYSGSVYMFRWNGSTWDEEQKLLASDGHMHDSFGRSVSISGDVAVVGAYKNSANGSLSGSAYVFRWNGSTWVEEQKLLASDGAAWHEFGESVSISGDVAVVGTYKNDDNGDESGSAYVYRWNGSTWVEEQKLLASDGAAYDQFGQSVSISGDVVVVGARKNDDNGDESGSAYIFQWNGSTWVEKQKLLASDGAADDQFGSSVFIGRDVAVIGASLDDDNGSNSGSAYVYRWNSSTWEEEQKLLASDGVADHYFGTRVAISGDVAVVAAHDNDNGHDAGAVYVTTVVTGTGVPHSADYNPSDWGIDLSELLRVIQLYSFGTIHCDVSGEDGYNPGPGDQTCTPHHSDYNPQDWSINFSELLRLIQLYNLGGYGLDPSGEDGFIPGLN